MSQCGTELPLLPTPAPSEGCFGQLIELWVWGSSGLTPLGFWVVCEAEANQFKRGRGKDHGTASCEHCSSCHAE